MMIEFYTIDSYDSEMLLSVLKCLYFVADPELLQILHINGAGNIILSIYLENSMDVVYL